MHADEGGTLGQATEAWFTVAYVNVVARSAEHHDVGVVHVHELDPREILARVPVREHEHASPGMMRPQE